MPPTRNGWNTGAKVIVASAVCSMVGYGLCASGISTPGGVTGYIFVFATVLFWGGAIGIVVGLIMATTQKK